MLAKILPPLQTRIASLIDDGYTLQISPKGRKYICYILGHGFSLRQDDGDFLINYSTDYTQQYNDSSGVTTGVGNTISLATDHALFLVGY